MATEAEDNQTAAPTATRDLVGTAIEAVKSQGQDINPYSVAYEANIAVQVLFFSPEWMAMITEARGDGSTYSIDSLLAERCQELEGEIAKLMEINQEIYDRALEMEERVIQQDAKISDLEEEAETLTMQLQNSWHLGYKKGQADAEAKAAENAATESAAAEPAKKPIIDIELSAEEKVAIQKEAAEAFTEKKQTGGQSQSQSIMSMIDIELPEENAAASQTNFSAEEGRDTSDNPVVSADHEPITEAPSVVPGEEAPAYNDKIFNAVADSYTPNNMVESYGGMSWREVETIYQYSSTGGNQGGQNLVYEPMSGAQQGQAATAADAAPSPSSRSETQPISVGKDGAPPPILKADAPAPKPEMKAEPKPNPTSTFTRLAARKPEIEPDPPMERTMSQFLGDTQSYINLDRVTLEPDDNSLSAKPAAQAPAQAAEAAAPPSAAQSQLETQTLQGAAQAMAAAAQARASGAIPPGDSASFMAAASAAAAAQAQAQNQAQSQPQAPSGPSDAKWGRREAGATYDGLTALDSDSTTDVLDLEKLDIFEGLEDIDDLSHIEVIEDVIIPEPPPGEGQKRGRFKSSEHVPVVSSDDLHDLIKSRIKKAEEPHEPPRADAFIASHAEPKDKGEKEKPEPAAPSPAATASTAEATSTTGESAVPPPVPTAKELEALRQGARNKFVGGKAAPTGTSSTASSDNIGAPAAPAASTGINPRAVPPEIRKACMILGVRIEDLNLKEVHEKWKAQIAAPGAHPDQGGDTESAIYLNTAKDTLVKYINAQAPKLGKKFGKGEK